MDETLDAKMLQLGNDLIESVRDYFSNYPDIEIKPNPKLDSVRDAYVAKISWLLNNDINRENKRSVSILIIISRESMQVILSESQKDTIFAKFKTRVQTNLKTFNPEHDQPINSPPKAEEWKFDL